MIRYKVWKLMADLVEEPDLDYESADKATKRAMVVARKWWRVLGKPTAPRKPERIPSAVVVREEGNGYPRLYHVVEVWPNRPPTVAP